MATECWCHSCNNPATVEDFIAALTATVRFIVCPDCGNKRCPKANHHDNACTNSNEPGQPGSAWENVGKPKPCPTTGLPLVQCKDWTDVTCEPNEYEPTMESGMQQCSRCGMYRHYQRERTRTPASGRGG